MNRLGGVMAAAGLLVAVACSGDDEPTAQPAEVEAAEETLPTLPPVATEAPTTVAPTAPSTTGPPETSRPTTTSVPVEPVRPGRFDWGTACRIPVFQRLTGGPQIEREFTLVVRVAGDGVLLSVDQLVERWRTLTEPEAASLLLSRGFLLPDVRLGTGGEFVEFVNLAATVDTALASAGVAGQITIDVAAYAGLVEFVTVGPWLGLWSDLDEYPTELTEVDAVTERIVGLPMPTAIRRKGAWDEGRLSTLYPGAALALEHLEFGSLPLGDVALEQLSEDERVVVESLVGPGPFADDDRLATRILVGAIMTESGRRPLSATLDFTITFNGQTLERFGVSSEFDWDGATSVEPGGCDLS